MGRLSRSGESGNCPNMNAPVIFAGVNGENAIRELIPSHSSTFEAIAIFGTIILVTLMVFVWAVLSRTRPHRRRSHHQRHRRPEQLPRKPTLAETGGLPPVRHDEPPPSA
jgi:hypothetical protein